MDVVVESSPQIRPLGQLAHLRRQSFEILYIDLFDVFGFPRCCDPVRPPLLRATATSALESKSHTLPSGSVEGNHHGIALLTSIPPSWMETRLASVVLAEPLRGQRSQERATDSQSLSLSVRSTRAPSAPAPHATTSWLPSAA